MNGFIVFTVIVYQSQEHVPDRTSGGPTAGAAVQPVSLLAPMFPVLISYAHLLKIMSKVILSGFHSLCNQKCRLIDKIDKSHRPKC